MTLLRALHNPDEGRGLLLGTTVLMYNVRMRPEVLVNRKEAKGNSDYANTTHIRDETSNLKIMSYL
jgi:hypothetical protein